jgi:hypothetical protein
MGGEEEDEPAIRERSGHDDRHWLEMLDAGTNQPRVLDVAPQTERTRKRRKYQ